MSHYALVNGVIYTGYDVLYQHAVVIAHNRIVDVLPESALTLDIKRIDLHGANLTAGFIDLQLNGCGGVMFNEETSVKTLEIMQQTNLRSGTTSYLPTFITASDEGMKVAIDTTREYLTKYQNQVLGLHLEGPYLSVAKKGVHREDYIREISPEMLELICQNGEVIKKITIAAENRTTDYISHFNKAGIVVSLGHSNATYQQAKQRIDQGMTFATHLYNAMSPISSGRESGVVGAVLDSDIYAGIIVDGLHVDWSNVRLAKKVKGDKLVIVTDAVAAAGADIDSFIFVGKKISVKNGKCLDENGSLGGAAITMIESIRNVIQYAGIPLDEALRMCNLYPARAIKVDDKLGAIIAGHIANLTVFNHNFEVLGTAVEGEWQWFN